MRSRAWAQEFLLKKPARRPFARSQSKSILSTAQGSISHDRLTHLEALASHAPPRFYTATLHSSVGDTYEFFYSHTLWTCLFASLVDWFYILPDLGRFYPTYGGALICANKDGEHGAARHGLSFSYSYQAPGDDGVQIGHAVEVDEQVCSLLEMGENRRWSRVDFRKK